MKIPTILFIRELSAMTPSGVSNHFVPQELLQELLQNGFINNFRFTFVGIYYSINTDTTIVGYPKYITEEMVVHNKAEVIAHVNLICRVIEKAQPFLNKSLSETTPSFYTNASNAKKRHLNRYDLAELILQDYMTYGVYYEKTTKIRRNVYSTIHWSATFQRATPIFDRDVVYLDTYHRQTKTDHSRLITQIHVWVLVQCARLLQGLGRYNEVELPEVDIHFDSLELNQFVPFLLEKLSVVFLEREIRLIKALSAWCGQSSFYHKQLGSAAFELVWEFAVKKVFGNIDDTRSGPPIYYIAGAEYKASGDSIPDILRAFKQEVQGHRVIGILDAKYYFPMREPRDGIIYGVPANSDIMKQLGYYQYMKKLYPQKDIDFTNAFLMPAAFKEQVSLFEYFGYATPNNTRYEMINEHLDADTQELSELQERVLLYRVNPHMLFTTCLQDAVVEDAVFYNEFVIPFYNQNVSIT